MGVVTEWKEVDLTGFFHRLKILQQSLSKAPFRNICKVMMNIYWEKKQVDNNNRQIRVLPVIRFFAAWDFSFPFFWEIQRSTANRDHPSIKCTKKMYWTSSFPFSRKKKEPINPYRKESGPSFRNGISEESEINQKRKKEKKTGCILFEWVIEILCKKSLDFFFTGICING